MVCILILLGAFVWLAFHSSKQELLDKKESASTRVRLAISEKPLALEQKSIAAAPSGASTDDTNEREENARAQGLLSSKNDHQRVEGLELLGAYPSPANEVILVRYLKSQENPEIRSTAAISLSTLENPTTSTIDGLLGTLEDPSEDVRFSALSTLEDYLTMVENNSPIHRHIQAGLKSKLQSSRLQADIKKEIEDNVYDR
jgi:HEAT repeat protein